MSNLSPEEQLEQRVRDSAPLLERLEDIRKRVGGMCSERRGPKMTIPVAWYDDDFFIATTVRDAIDALRPLETRAVCNSLSAERIQELAEASQLAYCPGWVHQGRGADNLASFAQLVIREVQPKPSHDFPKEPHQKLKIYANEDENPWSYRDDDKLSEDVAFMRYWRDVAFYWKERQPSVPPLNGLQQARAIIEALDPYVGAGARGAGLSGSDAVSAPVYAYRDTLLDKIDEAIERAPEPEGSR